MGADSETRPCARLRQAPRQIVPMLADWGEFVASVSTIYRGMTAAAD